jgi:hypothetical protein
MVNCHTRTYTGTHAHAHTHNIPRLSVHSLALCLLAYWTIFYIINLVCLDLSEAAFCKRHFALTRVLKLLITSKLKAIQLHGHFTFYYKNKTVL